MELLVSCILFHDLMSLFISISLHLCQTNVVLDELVPRVTVADRVRYEYAVNEVLKD